MTRIGIMTFLHNDNYGSTLQAWALQQTIKSLGYDAEHIDYSPSGKEKLLNLLTSGNSPALILDGLRKRAVKAGQAGAREKSASFRRFYQSQMKLSPVCHDKRALREMAQHYDMLVCGSDQIWSPVWLNPAYFLDFAGNKRRVAYAPSLGVSQMTSKQKARRISRWLRSFSAVSVREAEGARLLSQVTGTQPEVMPDPVCLMPRKQWLALAKKPAIKQPYMLCYFIGRNPDYWQRAAAIAAERRLPVVVIPVTEESFQQPYQRADGASPEEWLGWIAGANMVCTDSFHGTVFSALLGVEVQMMRRYREDDPESKNSRIDQLKRMLEVSGDRIVPGPQMDEKLAQARERGTAWLRQALA